MNWNEGKYSKLQEAFSHITLDGEPVGLDDGARTLMAAYLLGVLEERLNMVSDEDVLRLDLDDWWV